MPTIVGANPTICRMDIRFPRCEGCKRAALCRGGNLCGVKTVQERELSLSSKTLPIPQIRLEKTCHSKSRLLRVMCFQA